ncbi:MAG: zinc-binding protein [Methanobacteriales archaeon]|nr:zinc-binding protein [Methanobacteriales archaeon]
MTKKKIALAACSGMSPVGLVSRVAAADTREENENVISICMGATSADREGFRGLIKKYPIIAINGCEGECVNKILAQRDVQPVKTINVLGELNQEGLKPTDVSRLDEEGERCVLVINKKIKEAIKEEDNQS